MSNHFDPRDHLESFYHLEYQDCLKYHDHFDSTGHIHHFDSTSDIDHLVNNGHIVHIDHLELMRRRYGDEEETRS